MDGRRKKSATVLPYLRRNDASKRKGNIKEKEKENKVRERGREDGMHQVQNDKENMRERGEE